jgi:hypothetical protein
VSAVTVGDSGAGARLLRGVIATLAEMKRQIGNLGVIDGAGPPIEHQSFGGAAASRFGW